MKSDTTIRSTAKFEGKADNLVGKVLYDEAKKLVHINATQRFGPIDKEAWEYQVGGYQVMSKWLNDRKNRRLSVQDIKHYCKAAGAIAETIRLQGKIDRSYAGIEEDFVSF